MDGKSGKVAHVPRLTRNQRLQQEYPFLEGIINRPNVEPVRPDRQDKVDRLTIKVQRADAELMFRRPESLGIVDGGCIVSNHEPFRVGKYAEYLHVITKTDQPSGPRYLSMALKQVRVRDVFGMWQPAQVAYLVWVTVTAWHEPASDAERERGNDFGAFAERHMRIVIYKPPAKGFDWLYNSSTFADAYLTTDDLMMGALGKDPQYIAANEQLTALTKEFEQDVLLNGLRDLINASPARGMSGRFGAVSLMSYVIAGRVMFTFKDDRSFFTVVASETGRPGTGVHGIGGSLNRAEKLVRTVIKVWQASDDRAALFTDDAEVSYIF